MSNNEVTIYTKKEIKKIRKACELTREIFEKIKSNIRPGITTLELDQLAKKYCDLVDAEPAFFKYGQPPFPGAICASVNGVLIHGVPDNVPLKKGDVLGLDFGVKYKGFHGDYAETIVLDRADTENILICSICQFILYEAIKKAVIGNTIDDISKEIERLIYENRFYPVKEYAGHGVGKHLHEFPSIPNVSISENKGVIIQEGMVLAIEIMMNTKTPEVEVLNDKWSVKAKEGLGIHFEHTIVVTEDGPKILTKR